MRATMVFALAAIAAILCPSPVSAQASYELNFTFYRIAGTPVIYTERYPLALCRPINFDFENTHVSSIFKSLFAESGIPINVGDGLIAPPWPPEGSKKGTYDENARPRPWEYVSDGYVQEAKFEEVQIADILKRVLKPLRLGYKIEDGAVRVCKLEDAGLTPTAVTYQPTPDLMELSAGILFVDGLGITLGGTITHPERLQWFPPSAHVFPLGKPSIRTVAGQAATLDMMDSSPVEYFEQKTGDQFLRRESATQSGMSVSVTLHSPRSSDRISCSLSLNASFVEDRESAPGTVLNVGKPRFSTIQRSGELDLRLNSMSAIVTQFGDAPDSVLLGLVRATEISTPETPKKAGLPQYSLNTRIIEIRGEPDWKWWMRPYERAARIYAGAGQVLGPVLVPRIADSPKRFDWGRLGFDKVTWPAPDASRDVTSIVDHKFPYKQSKYSFRGVDSTPPRPAVDPSHPVFDAYKDVAPDAPPLTPADVQGKANTLSIGTARDANGRPVTQCEMFAIGEASPTPVAGVFRIEQKVLLNKARLQTDSPTIRRQLEFSCDTADDSMLAFLLPIADDEYWIVLTDFSLVKE